MSDLSQIDGLPVSAKVLKTLMERSDLTRLADLTGLDILALPVIAAFRPASQSLSVASGKGKDLGSAIVSAVMEAYEHAAAEDVRPDFCLRGLAEARADPAFADPATLPRDRRATRTPDNGPIRWVQFEQLTDGAPLWVPYDMVHLRLTVEEMNRNDGFLVSTNGLAAGTTRPQAILHGLAEVIERDAIAGALDTSGAFCAYRVASIDLPSLAGHDVALAEIVDHLAAQGLSIALNDLTNDLDVPVIHCRLRERPDCPTPLVRPCDGVGCAPTSEEAARRALFEAAQARATLISGARDDVLKRNYTETPGQPHDHSATRRLSDLPRGPEGDHAALSWMLERLAAAGFPQAAVCMLDAQPGATAVRVVVPGLEGVPMSAGYVPGRRAGRHRSAGSALQKPRPRAVAPLSHPATDLTRSAALDRRSRPVVFLGPSLSLDRARALIDADFRPPAAQGDLFKAARDNPAAIALIDGTFLSAPTVWHKEILWALSQGIPVWGGASIGALRAVEMEAFGMIGHGKVFADFRGAAVAADDLVAVQYAPADLGYAPVTEAAVDIAATLDKAVAEGILDRSLANTLWSVVAQTHFSRRVLKDLVSDMRAAPDSAKAATPGGLSSDQCGDLERLAAWLPSGRMSIKSQDAEVVLTRLRSALENGLATPSPVTSPETLLWREMAVRCTNPFLRDLL